MRDSKIKLIIFGLFIILLVFIVSKDNKVSNNADIVDNNELLIGINKYLEFLWMVDGAFNDSRYNESIMVNGKIFNNKSTRFVCNYDNKNSKCKAENFEESFNNLFSKNISYNDVYSDGLSYTWYEKNDNGFYFNNLNTCNVKRMSINQTIQLVDKTDDKLIYKVNFIDNVKEGIYKKEHVISRDFVLVKEDSSWKISKAYYHDLCYMDYYIG